MSQSYRTRLYEAYRSSMALPRPEELRAHLESRRPYMTKLIDAYVPPRKSIRVLELGCGYGSVLYHLQESGYAHLDGVDGSPQQVAAARALGLHCVRLRGVSEALQEAGDGSYDVVIAFDVLEHFTREELMTLMDEIHRVLAPGGRLIAHVPNAGGIFGGVVFHGDLTHETCFTSQSIRQLLALTGFGNIRIAEDVPVAHGLKSAVRRGLWAVFRSIFRLIYAAETGDPGREIILSQNLLVVSDRP